MKNAGRALALFAALALSSTACGASMWTPNTSVVSHTTIIVQSGGARAPVQTGTPVIAQTEPRVPTAAPEPAQAPNRLPHQSAGPLRATVFALPVGFNDVRQLGEQQPVIGSFTTDEINVEPREFQNGFPNVPGRYEWFGVRYEGRVFVDVGGKVFFRLNADDGANLYIDGALVVDNNGTHGAISKMGMKNLQPGFHSVRVDYFQGPQYHFGVQLFWIKADSDEEELFSTR